MEPLRAPKRCQGLAHRLEVVVASFSGQVDPDVGEVYISNPEDSYVLPLRGTIQEIKASLLVWQTIGIQTRVSLDDEDIRSRLEIRKADPANDAISFKYCCEELIPIIPAIEYREPRPLF